MRICIIGLGSIGCRHVTNIVNILRDMKEEYYIDALRSVKGRLEESISQYISTEYYDIDELPNNYDVIFVTNPTSKHYSTIAAVVNKTKHMFIEKPIFSSADENIEALNLKKDSIYYVACPMRHSALMQHIKGIVKNEQIYSVQAICSSYLPEWRPGTDYRKCYSAKRELGGGVTLDLIHEWDYIIDLFGFPKKIERMTGKYSELELDTDDLSVYIARYDDKIVEVHLDYFGRKSQRQLMLFCRDYIIEIDFLKNQIVYDGQIQKTLEVDNVDPYINEMEYFFSLIKGKCKNMNSINYATKVLKVVLI